jgi:hypothetical protein
MTDKEIADELIAEAEQYCERCRESFFLEKPFRAPGIELTWSENLKALFLEGMDGVGMGASFSPALSMYDTLMVHYLFPNLSAEARQLIASAIPQVADDLESPQMQGKLRQFLDLAEKDLTAIQLVIVEKLTSGETL